MRRIIFAAICLLCFASIAITAVLIESVHLSKSNRQMKNGMKATLKILNTGIDVAGVAYLDSLKPDLGSFRITFIDENNIVLFDNQRDITEMSTHKNRQEIISANMHGIGEASRISETTGRKTIYIAKLRDDGKIIRIGVSENDILIYPARFIPIVFLIIIFISTVVFFVAKFLTKSIINPINKIDLENPQDNNIYEELSPLLRRIKEQNDIVANQISKLQRRKNQFEIIAANMQEGLLILDRENNILHCNKSAKYLLGSKNHENIIGQNVLVMCRNDKFRYSINHADDEANHQENSFELHGKTIKIIANPIVLSGVKMGTAVLLVDVSEQADREKLRREFSANVSHELKTPLSVISGYSEIISNGLAKPKDIEDISKKIYNEAQHLLSLINDIIQISNLDENGNFAFTNTNILDSVEAVISRVKPKAEEKNITIKLFSAIDDKKIEILAVPRLLDEILFNIIENSIKYNKENGEIEVSISQKDNFTVIEFFDTGIGIPHSQRHRIFERFYRVDSSRTERKDGTGLGLSIVKHAVKIHKGNIKLSSLEGEWTKVTVSFPIVKN